MSQVWTERRCPVRGCAAALRGQSGQAELLALAAACAVLAGAVVLFAFGNALDARGKHQRAAEVAAISAAQVEATCRVMRKSDLPSPSERTHAKFSRARRARKEPPTARPVGSKRATDARATAQWSQLVQLCAATGPSRPVRPTSRRCVGVCRPDRHQDCQATARNPLLQRHVRGCSWRFGDEPPMLCLTTGIGFPSNTMFRLDVSRRGGGRRRRGGRLGNGSLCAPPSARVQPPIQSPSLGSPNASAP
jgi:hypothetical protein